MPVHRIAGVAQLVTCALLQQDCVGTMWFQHGPYGMRILPVYHGATLESHATGRIWIMPADSPADVLTEPKSLP